MFKRELPVEKQNAIVPDRKIGHFLGQLIMTMPKAYVWAENRGGVWEPIAKATMPFVAGVRGNWRDAAL